MGERCKEVMHKKNSYREKGHGLKKNDGNNRTQEVVEITVCIRTFWPEVKWRMSSKVSLERLCLGHVTVWNRQFKSLCYKN